MPTCPAYMSCLLKYPGNVQKISADNFLDISCDLPRSEISFLGAALFSFQLPACNARPIDRYTVGSDLSGLDLSGFVIYPTGLFGNGNYTVFKYGDYYRVIRT